MWCLRIETGYVLVSYNRAFVYNYFKNSLQYFCTTMNCLRQTGYDAVDKNQSIISHPRPLWFILMLPFHVWLCPLSFVKPSRLTKILYEFMISLMCVKSAANLILLDWTPPIIFYVLCSYVYLTILTTGHIS